MIQQILLQPLNKYDRLFGGRYNLAVADRGALLSKPSIGKPESLSSALKIHPPNLSSPPKTFIALPPQSAERIR